MKKYFKPTTESIVLQGSWYLMTPPSQQGLDPNNDTNPTPGSGTKTF